MYFRDPETRKWHTLMWEHAPSMDMPLSEDALEFARKLAASKYTYPDDRRPVADLLQRWNLGLGDTLAERRMALRLSRDTVLLDETPTQDEVATLPSVARCCSRGTSGRRGRNRGGQPISPIPRWAMTTPKKTSTTTSRTTSTPTPWRTRDGQKSSTARTSSRS